MSAFVLTRKARNDLITIAGYTERTWGREQRNIYLRQLDDAFHFLAQSPLAGRDCAEIRQGYRKLPILAHIIFYRALAVDRIEIVRVLHKSMDVESGLVTWQE